MLHPLQVPADLRSKHATVLAQSGDVEDVIRGAVRQGIFLGADHLKALHAEYLFELPERGQGHGKHGALIKQDYAEGLVRMLFGKEATDEMVAALLGRSASTLGKAGKHTSNILAAFRSIDPTDQRDFQELVSLAHDEEKRAEARVARADMAAPHGSAKHTTPAELKQFLPVGEAFICKLNRHPALQRYQVYITDKKTSPWTETSADLLIACCLHWLIP